MDTATNENLVDSRAFFEHLRALIASGAISYEEAKEQSKDRIEAMNAKGREIAKKHGKKFRPFSFTAMMR